MAQDATPDGDSGLPLFRPLWHVPTATDHAREQLLAAQLRALRMRDSLVLPQQRPMIVGDFAIMRTLYQVVGVEIRTGRRVFVFPFSEDLISPQLAATRPQSLSPSQVVYRNFISLVYAQRMLTDSLYHTLASDGEDVYLIDGIPMEPPLNSRGVLLRDLTSAQAVKRDQAAKYNRLVSLAVDKEGRLNWMAGSESGEDEPALARAVFYGGPVVDEGRIFAVVRIEEAIRLVCLDTKTGKLKWSISVGTPGVKPAPIPLVHRLLGASLATTQDVVVCRFEGVITCIDRNLRKRLWQRVPKVEEAGGRFGPMATRMVEHGYGWTDNRIFIIGNRVISAAGTVGPLECLDIETGDVKWSQPREKMVTVATVNADHVVVLQTDGVRAINMSDGKDSWPGGAVELPNGAMVSGRGVVIQDKYYQPTTNSEVIAIDMENGNFTEHAQTEFELGNLATVGDRLLSQNVDKLAMFWRVGALQQKVSAKLKENPDDLWALARQCEISVQRGQWKLAASSFERAVALEPKDVELRATIAAVGTRLIAHDFSSNKRFVDAIESLSENPATRQRLQMLAVHGWIEELEYTKARSALMALLPTIESEATGHLIRLEPDWRIQPSRWFRETLRRIDALESK